MSFKRQYQLTKSIRAGYASWINNFVVANPALSARSTVEQAYLAGVKRGMQLYIHEVDLLVADKNAEAPKVVEAAQ